MKRQFIVTIEGEWYEGDRKATAAQVQAQLRKSIKDGFEFLAKRTEVQKYKPDAAAQGAQGENNQGGGRTNERHANLSLQPLPRGA